LISFLAVKTKHYFNLIPLGTRIIQIGQTQLLLAASAALLHLFVSALHQRIVLSCRHPKLSSFAKKQKLHDHPGFHCGQFAPDNVLIIFFLLPVHDIPPPPPPNDIPLTTSRE
jgi:hypothetical protein